jgi:putative transposase
MLTGAQANWFSAASLAALNLPGVPSTKKGIQVRAEAEGWAAPEREGQAWRRRQGRGGGVEFSPYVLPMPAQAALAIRLQEQVTAPADAADSFVVERRREDLWRRFDALPDRLKDRARGAHKVVEAVEMMVQAGTRKTMAIMQIARMNGVGHTTINNWYRDLRGIDRCDWLPALAPHYAPAQSVSECPAKAWEILKADYLRLSAPSFEACMRRLGDEAKKHEWTLPSTKTLKRRMDALGPQLLTLCRKGEDALVRMYPPQKRDRSMFHAMEAVNADGHRFDVFVKWPEGDQVRVVRPVMVVFQDLYSGMILSWRLDISENKEAVRLAFGDMVERYGIPSHCWLDNGRNFASKWLTGGVENRFRFKLREDEPQGIMPQMGVQVHWTRPYSGQSKPIERAFRDLAGDLSKHPKFEGAYTGNTPMNKPDNYNSKAVPLDEFVAVVAAGIREHNERVGRRSAVCAGKRSFAQAFAASYASAPIKKATEEQRRLWLMAAEAITVDRRTGVVTLEGNRFWADFLHEHRGEKVVVRFDPQNLQADLHVYRLDGTYLGAAPCQETAGFADKTAAQTHGRARKAWVKAQKEMRDAERRMSLKELQQVYDRTNDDVPEEVPEARVVRPSFPAPATHGNAALAVLPDEDAELLREEAEEAEMRRVRNVIRMVR